MIRFLEKKYPTLDPNSDFYTLSQTKLSENQATQPTYGGTSLPPPGKILSDNERGR